MQQKLQHAFENLIAKIPADRQDHVECARRGVPIWSRQVGEVLTAMQACGCKPTDVLKELRIGLTEGEEATTVKPQMLRRVPMPDGLTNDHLTEAMNYTMALIAAINRDMREGVGQPLAKFIQANNFSGIVSNMLTDALNRFSPYKHNHDQRYPDLKNAQGIGLEMKAANKAGKGGESHNAHGGWHLIACFSLDKASCNVRFVQVEIAELVSYLDEADGDWHYCGSKRNDEGSQRTETYYTTNRGTWKLRDGSAYLDTDLVDISRWRREGAEIPQHSPCFGMARRERSR